MNYNSAKYIKQYNKTLNEHCDWEIQLSTDEKHKDSFEVYHLNTHPSEQDTAVFIGYIPIATPVESLICSESFCFDYCRLGMDIGLKTRIYLSAETGRLLFDEPCQDLLNKLKFQATEGSEPQ
ncbi:hypothetical protein HX871_29810 [Pseudomonas reactans]|jgi:hypothetical protein|uniref:Uncharacterized protein n=1 Tax=Pseudomonas reactans TaxID=117680 RepID=A0A7Y8FYU9_9PSED|nr:hypothetical protein [Pseudomonas reactans]NWA45895.1 hypothetical protein [Pseudomonas reactans]NWD98619.1 hypothetical protein [Pseudomonas reactans]NWE88010.1 hypothetical protein [Pseudomonas reactans]